MVKYIIVHNKNQLMMLTVRGAEFDFTPLDPQTIQDALSTIILNLKEVSTLWMSDLKLYGRSLIKLLFQMGYKDMTASDPDVKDMGRHSFKYVVSGNGNFYKMIVRTQKKSLYIYNTDNLLANLDNEEIFKAWGNGSEWDGDLQKVAVAVYRGVTDLKGFQEKRTPFTISMVAGREWRKTEELYHCENLVNCKDRKAPNGETVEKYIRKSYNAGWNYLNNKISRDDYKGENIYVYDVNSLYPYIASTQALPWGEPTNFTGAIPKEALDDYHYYFIRVKIQFDLKEGSFPYIQKRGDFLYRFTDYLSTSDVEYEDKIGSKHYTSTIIGYDGKPQEVYPEFVFTKTDWELIQRHYNIRKYEILDGIYYRTSKCIFKYFMTDWYKIKCTTKDPGTKRISKMILNSVIGGLAKRADRTATVYALDGSSLSQQVIRSENPSPCYIHIASAILSYAREYTYEAACRNREHFLYSDTDSIHIFGEKVEGIRIDATKLGYWKLEHKAQDAVYYKRKSYTLYEDGKYELTMAGVEHNYQKLIEHVMDGDSTKQIEADASKGVYGSADNIFRTKTYYSIKDLQGALHMNGWESIDDSKIPVEWVEEELERDPNYKTPTDESVQFEYINYSRDYAHLAKMKEEMDNMSDKITALRYIPYPSGIDECDEFNIHHQTYWLSLNYRNANRL